MHTKPRKLDSLARCSASRSHASVRSIACLGLAALVIGAVTMSGTASAGSKTSAVGKTGDNISNGVGSLTVLDQASGLVPSRFQEGAYLVANQHDVQRFVPGPDGSKAALSSTVVYDGPYTQLEAMARGTAPVTNMPDRVLVFQAHEWGEHSKLVVLRESPTTGVVTREAEYALATAAGADLPNVEAVLYESVSRRAWFFTKNTFPTAIYMIDFRKEPVDGAFRAGAYVGSWSWRTIVPLPGTACKKFTYVQMAPTEIAVDPTDHRSILIGGNQRYTQPTAAALAAYRRPVGGDWRDIGQIAAWRTGQVRFGTGSDSCFPYDFGGLGLEALAFEPYKADPAGAPQTVRIWMVQDNTKTNRVGSRVITVQHPTD